MITGYLLRVPQLQQCFHHSHHVRMRSCPHLCPAKYICFAEMKISLVILAPEDLIDSVILVWQEGIIFL